MRTAFGFIERRTSVWFKGRDTAAEQLQDRTEVDTQFSDLLVEAKLSETDCQTARPELLERYPRFDAVFDVDRLEKSRGVVRSYPLLRAVLAAEHHEMRFAVFCDARRPNLRERWFRVMAAVQSAELRSRMLFITWREMAAYVLVR